MCPCPCVVTPTSYYSSSFPVHSSDPSTVLGLRHPNHTMPLKQTRDSHYLWCLHNLRPLLARTICDILGPVTKTPRLLDPTLTLFLHSILRRLVRFPHCHHRAWSTAVIFALTQTPTLPVSFGYPLCTSLLSPF